jgi:hypothetical protein
MLKLVIDYMTLLYVTWVLFLAVMSVKAAKDAGTLPTATYVMAYPMYIVALLFDFALNMASSFVFMEPPQELLLTHRCDRHLLESDGWRWMLAATLCKYMLDPFQIGGHCRGK